MTLYKELSYQVMGAVFTVHQAIGPGLLEYPYHNALFYQLRKQGLSVQSQVPYSVVFEGHVVGEYFADLVVENKIILEIKSVKTLNGEMEAQLINYLKISGAVVWLVKGWFIILHDWEGNSELNEFTRIIIFIGSQGFRD